MAQMKEQNRTPEKELSDVEIANLADAEFRTVVIIMFRDLIEYGKSIREEMKVMLSEIKKTNHRKPTVKRRKLGFKSTIWNIRKKQTFNQNKIKKQEFRKTRRV